MSDGAIGADSIRADSILAVSELTAVPWRNGAGLTRPIAEGDGWWISIATVTDGAVFSAFPGRRRVFVPLEDDRITLIRTLEEPGRTGASTGAATDAVPEAATEAVLGSDVDGAIRFDGAVAVRAEVRTRAGAARRGAGALPGVAAAPPGAAGVASALALNIMTRPGVHARLTFGALTGALPPADPTVRASILIAGTVTDASGRTHPAPAVLAPGATGTAAAARFIRIRVSPSLTTDPDSSLLHTPRPLSVPPLSDRTIP